MTCRHQAGRPGPDADHDGTWTVRMTRWPLSMRIRLLGFFLLALPLLVARPPGTTARGDDVQGILKPPELEQLGWLEIEGASIEDVAIDGSYAFAAAAERGLLTIDISDRTNPRLVAELKTNDRAEAVFVAGDIAYVADTQRGLLAVDVSNPLQPRLGTFVDTPGLALDVVTGLGHAFVADGREGLFIADLSEPLAPSMAGAVWVGGNANGLAISGDFVYVATGESGWRVFNVRLPSKPDRRSIIEPKTASFGALVSQGLLFFAGGPGGYFIHDASNPAIPLPLGKVDGLGSTLDVAVSGSYAYAAAGSNGLRVVDFSKPAAPRLVLTVPVPGSVSALAMADGDIIIASRTAGLLVVGPKLRPTSAPSLSATPLPSSTRSASATFTTESTSTPRPATATRRPTTATMTRTPSPDARALGTQAAATLTALAPPRRHAWLPAVTLWETIYTPQPPTITPPTDTPPPTAVRCATDESEPNNLPRDAVGQPILCPGQPIRGALTLADDPPDPRSPADHRGDYYTLLIDGPLTARVRLDPSGIKANVDYDLVVYGCSSEACSRVAYSGKRGRAVDEVTVPMTRGTYFVSVEPDTEIRSDETYELGWEILP